MGRAFPEAQMTKLRHPRSEDVPAHLADVRDNAVVVARAASWKWMERISRKACVEVGSIRLHLQAPRTGKEIKESRSSAPPPRPSGSAGQCRRPRGHRDPSTRVLE